MFGDGDGGRGGMGEDGGRIARAPVARVTTRRAGLGSAPGASPQPSHSSARSYIPQTRCSSKSRLSIARARGETRGARGVLCSPKSVRRIRAGFTGRDDLFVMTSIRTTNVSAGVTASLAETSLMDAGRLAGVDKKKSIDGGSRGAVPSVAPERTASKTSAVRQSVSRSSLHAHPRPAVSSPTRTDRRRRRIRRRRRRNRRRRRRIHRRRRRSRRRRRRRRRRPSPAAAAVAAPTPVAAAAPGAIVSAAEPCFPPPPPLLRPPPRTRRGPRSRRELGRLLVRLLHELDEAAREVAVLLGEERGGKTLLPPRDRCVRYVDVVVDVEGRSKD